MSGKFQDSIHCTDDLVFHPNDRLSVVISSLLINKKRWHLAFAKINCSRALLSLFNQVLAKNKKKISVLSTPEPSFLTINIDHEPAPGYFSNVNKTVLSMLVKEKNLDQFLNLGGAQGIAISLESDVNRGIHGAPQDIAERRNGFGTNNYSKPPTKGFFHFVFEAFKDPTILILLACAALSLGFGIKENGLKQGWYDGGSIFLAVFLVISVSAISNFRQNRQFEKLSKVSNNIAVQVVRNGRRQQISIFDIVVGDVVCLKTGDQVPADGLFLDRHSLQVDESSMTGESDHVEINQDRNPFLFSGTKVTDGYATMLITSVGMNTTWGQMMSTISQDSNEQTPLQARLNKLTSSIGKVGLAVAFLVLLVLLVRFFTGNTNDKNGNKEFNGFGKTKEDDVINGLLRIMAAAVTIVVVAIPEGLPLAVTLTLAYSVTKSLSTLLGR